MNVTKNLMQIFVCRVTRKLIALELDADADRNWCRDKTKVFTKRIEDARLIIDY